MRILLYFRQNITHQYDVRIELKSISGVTDNACALRTDRARSSFSQIERQIVINQLSSRSWDVT